MNTSLETLSFHDLFENADCNQPLPDQTCIIEPNVPEQPIPDYGVGGNISEQAFVCMDTSEMTVFLIDDDPDVRDALTLLLKQDNLTVESFGSAYAFLDICHPEMQGCAIVDLNMPGMNGIQLQEELAQRDIPLPIVFLTGSGNIPLSVKAIKAGALDFLTKPVTHEKLLSSIQIALMESQRLQCRRKTNQHYQEILSVLTQRENDVMKLALEGQTSKKIANHLGISHRTVEIHKARLMKKTGAENILDLARIVQDAGVMIDHGLQNDLQDHQTTKL